LPPKSQTADTEKPEFKTMMQLVSIVPGSMEISMITHVPKDEISDLGKDFTNYYTIPDTAR
jgi:hypothetical protein